LLLAPSLVLHFSAKQKKLPAETTAHWAHKEHMNDRPSHPQTEFNRLYSDVSANVAAAMAEVDALEVEHKQGKQEIGNIMQRLRGIQAHFDGELKLLEEHAEWDNFTMAFFGETNAGKSTIIESLRILFNEQARQGLLEKNAHNVLAFENALIGHVNEVRQALRAVYAAYTADVAQLRQDTAAVGQIVRDESSARIQIARDESSARVQIANDETSARVQIVRDESSARIQRKLWLFALGGAGFGAALTAALTLFVGK
jgi:hypothetical protein